MKRRTLITLPALVILLLAVTTSFAQEERFITGKVVSVAVDDPTETRGLSANERRYVVRIELDTTGDTILGFGESGRPLAAQQAMLDLLLLAVEKDWPVTLRTSRIVSGGSSGRSHARIVTVSVRR